MRRRADTYQSNIFVEQWCAILIAIPLKYIYMETGRQFDYVLLYISYLFINLPFL